MIDFTLKTKRNKPCLEEPKERPPVKIYSEYKQYWREEQIREHIQQHMAAKELAAGDHALMIAFVQKISINFRRDSIFAFVKEETQSIQMPRWKDVKSEADSMTAAYEQVEIVQIDHYHNADNQLYNLYNESVLVTTRKLINPKGLIDKDKKPYSFEHMLNMKLKHSDVSKREQLDSICVLVALYKRITMER